MAIPRISPSGPLSPTTPVGGLQSTSNQGGGSELALPLAGTDAPFRTLEAGMNVSIVTDGDVLRIAATPGGPTGTDTVINESSVPGASCSDALDALLTGISTNASAIANLGSDDIANDSGVAGANVSAALDNLAAAIPPAAPVDSVAGSNGITPAGAQTGVVVLSGAGLLAELASPGAGTPLTMAKSGQNGQIKTLTAGANITLTPSGDDIEIAATAAPGGGSAAISTYPLSTTQIGRDIETGSGGTGNIYGMFAFAQNDMTLASLAAFIMQPSGAANSLRLAIYNTDGVLLIQSVLGNPTPAGTVILGMQGGGTFALTKGTGYYFCLWSNANAMLAAAIQGLSTSGTPPALHFFAANNATFPADISASFGNRPGAGVWAGGISA